MSSSRTDDYAGLMAPWKPITEAAMKSITSPRNKIQIDDGVKEEVVAWTDSMNAVDSFDSDTQDDDVEHSNKDTDIAIDDELQVGAIFHHGSTIFNVRPNTQQQEASYTKNLGFAETDSPDVEGSIDDGFPMSGTKITDTDDDTSQHIDTQCVAVSTCLANSGDHRKVVSHIFGRNKTCTRDLPHNLWIFWCRKHYQRMKYRAEDNENWHLRQMELVRDQLQIFDNWGKVRSWTIALRRAEDVALAKMNKEAKMNKDGVTNTNQTPPCWERFLVPYLGANKTFAKVWEVLDIIQVKFDEEEFQGRSKKLKAFPGVEFLPMIYTVKEVKKPAPAKSGEGTYKKITLDQSAFKRKTRANAEYAKEKAAKKAGRSNTPKSSRTHSQKAKAPDTDDRSDSPATLKREASTPDIGTIILIDATHNSADKTPTSKETKRKSLTPVPKAAPLADQPNSQATKRRRLTRGYEKHGSNGEDTAVMGKEEQGETEDEKLPQERV